MGGSVQFCLQVASEIRKTIIDAQPKLGANPSIHVARRRGTSSNSSHNSVVSKRSVSSFELTASSHASAGRRGIPSSAGVPSKQTLPSMRSISERPRCVDASAQTSSKPPRPPGEEAARPKTKLTPRPRRSTIGGRASLAPPKTLLPQFAVTPDRLR